MPKLLTNIVDGVATVTLNRAERANALDLDAWHDLRRAFLDIDGRSDVRAVVLCGAGDNFCAGIDLSLLGSLMRQESDCASRRSEALEAFILDLQDAVTSIESCRKPVIAAIQGACFGGGVDIACAADIRLAVENTRFCVKEIDMAVIADLGVIQRLPRIVGEGRARELILSARVFDGAEAERIGFVTHACPDAASLECAAQKISRNLAAKSPVAMRGTKESLNLSRDRSVAEGLAHVALLNASRLLSTDFQEALSSQKERRTPVFRD